MSTGPYGPGPRDGEPPTRVDAGRLWASGVFTAIVAALVVAVGILISQELLNVNVYGAEAGALGLMITAAVAAIGATVLAHALLLSVPQPMQFFGWITGLTVTVVVVLALSRADDLASKLVTAAIYLVTGAAIASLIAGAASSARVSGGSR